MNKKFRKDPCCGLLPNMPNETMQPDRMRINTNGKAEAAKHSFVRKGTARDFRSGMPIGNGDFGASMHGLPDNLTFNIAKNDLWWDDFEAPEPCYPDGGIENVRKKVSDGDETIKLDMFEASNRRVNLPIQTSAARLTLHLLSGGFGCNIREELDISTAVAKQYFSCDNQNGSIFGQDYLVTANVSRVDEVMRISVSASDSSPRQALGTVRFELTRDPMEVPAVLTFGRRFELIDGYEKEIDKYYSPVCFTDGDYFGFNMRLRAGENPTNSPDVHYTVMARVGGGEIRLSDIGYSVMGTGRFGKSFEILLTVVSTHDAEDTYAEAKRRLESAFARNTVHVLLNTSQLTSHDTNRSWIRLPKIEYSMPWYWGIYEAMSARRPSKFAAGYVAPWFQSSYVNWGHHILTYEQPKTNLGLLATNHAELLEPWFRLCFDAKEKLQKYASDFYNCRGTAYPHAISGTGTVIASSAFLNGTIMNISTTGETVKYAWDYYDFTGDKEYLLNVGYPILKQAALFYHDYLLTDENGEKYIFPSRSQECVACPGLSNEFMTNSLIDLALFKFILSRAAESAEILGIDAELAAEWRNDVSALRKDYALWPDGTWKTAEDIDDISIVYGNPPVSDLCPICITDEVDKWRGSDEMKAAAAKSVEKFVDKNKMPWDMSYGILSRLRMGDKDYARLALELLPKCREGGNLNRSDACDYDESNEMKPDGQHSFFVDKGGAYLSEVITEMLLQSQGEVIRIFPAYPEDIGDAAFFSLRARGAFLVSAEMRNQKPAYAIIRSLRGNECRFMNVFGEKVSVRNLETNEKVDFTETDGDIIFKTVAEHEYVIENIDRPLESFEKIN
ncbi:MAG: glycoside hydrolase N-terminal domain-containing protein [Clostridia bacterium]|nr:glycoside hydrolase N-terminal domain-containing protein [Clostridia bacterium]